ncbi:MAG: RagB/SusD family nutrient uptake outer membrane protein, partial [Ginsengibacter sp.]
MEKKNIRRIYFAVMFIGLIAFSCQKSFLEVQPSGVLGDEEVTTPAGVAELLVAAYSDLDGQYNPNGFNWYAEPDNWLYGSVCGGDAHKGSDPGDQALAYAIATFASLPNNDYYETRWEWLYD